MRILICFCILIVANTALLSAFLLSVFNVNIRNKTATLISADSRQLELNISSYLEKVEKTATLLFSDEIYYKYDATDESVEKYEQVKCEEAITERINDLGMMENFSDFGIIYANDHVAGWISNTTQNLFSGEGIYEEFASHIKNERTEDAWVFGVKGNIDRLYYVKRINQNAVLVISFYNRELESVFAYPEELDGMTIRLSDEKNRILYSSDKEEIGNQVPDEIIPSVGEKGKRSVITDKNLINTNICKNGWKVVCTIPLKVIMRERSRFIGVTIVFAFSVTIVFLILSYLIFRRMIRTLNGLFSNLSEKAELDRLSGLLNKNSYEERVSERLQNKVKDEHALMVVLDVDFFKPINDNLGHARGDVVIATLGKILRESFSERFLIGRIGGDEFSVFALYSGENRIDMRQGLERSLVDVRGKFLEEFHEENARFGTSMSAGVVLMEEEGDTFTELYKKADSALYISKENGKGRTSWYGEANG